MSKYFKILLVAMMLVFNLFVFSPRSQADIAADPYPFVYLFRLYYDNGQLFADRDFEFKYDLIAEPFVQPELSTATPYKGEVISVSGNVLGNFQFDPAVVRGKISVKGPYFANAAEVKFYNDRGQFLLTLDVGASSVCNDDSICDSDVGEDYQNCPNDCPRPSPSPTYQPPAPSIWQNMLTPILIAVAVIIAVLIVWGIIKRRRIVAGQEDRLPPAQPLTQ